MGGLTVLEARSREWPFEWLAQGREEGREEGQLAMLRRLASCRFGAATAEALLAELTSTIHVRLEAAAELILDWETGTELLDRVNGKPKSVAPRRGSTGEDHLPQLGVRFANRSS